MPDSPAQSLFNVQTIDPDTGREGWVTVRAADLEAARAEAGRVAHAESGARLLVGEVRPADVRVAQRAAAEDDLDAIPLAPAEAPAGTKPCGVCGGPMAFDSPVCSICGYDERVGFESSRHAQSTFTKDEREVKCRQCGYDLRGLRSSRCPECGTDNARVLASRWIDQVPTFADKLTKWKPVIAFAVGFAVSMAIGASMDFIVEELILHGVMSVIGFLVVSMCVVMWLGNDTTWGMLFVRVAAIYAVTHAIGSGLRFLIGVQFLVSGVQIFLTMFVAVWLMDLDDMIDGAILGVLLWITWFFATLFLFQVVLA